MSRYQNPNGKVFSKVLPFVHDGGDKVSIGRTERTFELAFSLV